MECPFRILHTEKFNENEVWYYYQTCIEKDCALWIEESPRATDVHYTKNPPITTGYCGLRSK